MATLKSRRTKWYSRVRWYDDIGKQNEKQIALKTSDYGTAIERNKEVEKYEDAIKAGVNILFPWENKNGKMKIVRYDLTKAVDDYLSYSIANGNKEGTIKRAEYCFKNIKTVLGSTFPINTIKVSDVEHIKQYFKGKLTDNGINMILSRMRSLLNWCRDVKQVLETSPRIKFIRTAEKIPSYLREEDMNKILSSDEIEPFYKRVFQMYWETGMRLREVFIGKIEGNWFIVKPEDSKTGLYREIPIQEHHKTVLMELQRRVIDSNATFRTATGHYSKVFKKVMRKIGREDLHFHNLRDTFAIMRYLETRDIYQVSKELGHTTVKVTEKYAKFRISRLEQDFPILAKEYRKIRNVNSQMRDTLLWDTNLFNAPVQEDIMA